MEGVNKKLSLLGDSVDIFKGIPFAAAPKALENPQRHPGWQGGRAQARGGPGDGVGGAAAVLTPAPPAAGRDPEGQGLQEAVPAGHHHPGQHLWGRGLPLPQHLGPPGQEGRSAPPTLQEAPRQPQAPQHGAGWGTRRAGGVPLGSPGLLPAPPPVSRDLPVMIWIYGGAFLMGSGQGANFLSNYLYDGEELATRGNVIVVTFNYRVGPLGFLSTGDANLPGRLGAWGPGGGVCRAPRVLKQLLPAP